MSGMDWDAVFSSRDRDVSEHMRPTARMFAGIMKVFQDEGFSREEAFTWTLAVGQQILALQARAPR